MSDTNEQTASKGTGTATGETRQGLVEPLAEGISFCMDGAEYELVSRTVDGEQRLRLRATSGHTRSVLRRYAGTGTEVSVTGEIITVECTRMDVQHAEPALVAT